MAVVSVWVLGRHDTHVTQERGRGVVGGWVWRARCRCGWSGFSKFKERALEEAVEHLDEDEVRMDFETRTGYMTFARETYWIDHKGHRRIYAKPMGRVET